MLQRSESMWGEAAFWRSLPVHSYQALQHGRVWFFLPVRAEPCWLSPSGAAERGRKPLCSAEQSFTHVQHPLSTAHSAASATGCLFPAKWSHWSTRLKNLCKMQCLCCRMAVCRSWLLAARCATAFQLLKGPISGTSHLADGRGEEQKSAKKNFNYSPAQGTLGHSFGYPFLYFDNPVAIKNRNTVKEMLYCKGRGRKALQSSLYNHWRKHTEVRDHWGRVLLSSSVIELRVILVWVPHSCAMRKVILVLTCIQLRKPQRQEREHRYSQWPLCISNSLTNRFCVFWICWGWSGW